jgi:hypothetical protein
MGRSYINESAVEAAHYALRCTEKLAVPKDGKKEAS